MPVVAISSTWSQMLEPKTFFSSSTQKSERDFLVQVPTSQTSKELAVGKKNKNRKVYGKCNRKVYLFKKWEISLVHYKRGYSGPGMLGEFVVVCLCDIWGLPQFSLIATMCTMLCLYINFKQDYLFTFHKILTFMLGFPKHTFRIEYITKSSFKCFRSNKGIILGK